MKYSNVWFDADGTLFDFLRCEAEAVRETMASVGIAPSDELVRAYSEINDGMWKMLERGETTRDRLKVDRFADFFAEVGYQGDPAAMAEDYVSALSRQTHLLDGALELIQALYGKCRLYIVTNGITSVQKSRFGSCPLAPYFDACFISEEMGCAKPEKRFFDLVAAAIEGFDPSRAIVIGDSLSSDIQGGINAGLATCWYNPKGIAAPAHMKIDHTVTSLCEIKDIILGSHD